MREELITEFGTADGAGVRFIKAFGPEGHEDEEGYYNFISLSNGDMRVVWYGEHSTYMLVEERPNEMEP